ncbi:MAG: BatA domain-containing protein [Phycisphaerales bacterium]
MLEQGNAKDLVMDGLWLQLRFLEPAMLLGCAGVLLPVAAHWWLRRLSPAVRWPSVRLLLAAERARTGRQRWRDVVLLVMRCAAVVLIAAAFARPMFREAPPPPGADGEGGRVVLILDGSASMQRDDATSGGGVSLFDRAKAEVMARRDALERMGKRVTVLMAAGRTQVVSRDELPGAGATDERADLSAAVTYAERWKDVTGIELFSDMQASGFAGEGVREDERLVWHRYGQDAGNVALEKPGVEVAGMEAALRFSVANQSDAEREVTIAYSGDVKRAATRVKVAARSATEVRVGIGRLGDRTVHMRAHIEADALMLDNELAWMIVPAARKKIAVIGGGRAAMFVRRALEVEGSGWEVVKEGAELAVTVGEGVSDLPGVRWMGGAPGIAPGSAPGSKGEGKLTLMDVGDRPWKVFGVSGCEQLQQRMFARTDAPPDAPPESPPKVPPDAAGLGGEVGNAKPRAAGPPEVAGTAGVKVLAVWSGDGEPAVVWDAGRRVVMTNVDLSEGRSDWVRSPLFLPVLREWLKLAADEGAAEERRVHAGERARWTVSGDVGADARLVGPGGEDVGFVVRGVRKISGSGEPGAALAPGKDSLCPGLVEAEVDHVGMYRWVDGNGRELGGWCVTVDERESDLRGEKVGDHQMEEPGTTLAEIAPGKENSLRLDLDKEEGQGYWAAVLAGALGMLVLEAWLAGWMGRPRKEDWKENSA